jgi:hypothetical protein
VATPRKSQTSPETPKATPTKSAAPKASKEAEEPKSAAPASPEPAKEAPKQPGTYSITIPLDRELVTSAVNVAMVPVTTAKRLAQSKNGLPAYLGIGGLAVLGVVEWPVVAAAGAGLAVMRRWGPLRPESNGDQPASKPEKVAKAK